MSIRLPQFLVVVCDYGTVPLMAYAVCRQAFSTQDVAAARAKLETVSGLQRAVDNCWKSVRWLADATAYARDRAARHGLPLGALFALSLIHISEPTRPY